MSSLNSAHMLETPEASTPKAGKVLRIGQSAGKKFTEGEELLYATGLLLGDGCLSAVPNKHCATLHKAIMFGCMDLDIVEEFAEILSRHFGCHSSIKHIPERNMHEYRTSKTIAFDYFSANTAYKTKFPDSLRYSTNDEKLAFLAGLLDTDGFASKTITPERMQGGYLKKQREQFRMGFTNTRFIMELTDLLDKLKIQYGKIWVNNHKTDYIGFNKVGKQLTRFTVPINPMSFLEAGGYFKCKRKQAKLMSYLEQMKTSYFEPQRLNAERLSAMV